MNNEDVRRIIGHIKGIETMLAGLLIMLGIQIIMLTWALFSIVVELRRIIP